MLLSAIEVRILGALIEKKHTTPEYYPMSLNAISNACNQKSNRDPVTEYSEDQIEKCIEQLREKRLVIRVTGAGIKVPKYRELLTEQLSVSLPEEAVLCILMLRGAQTSGEIKNRCERIYDFIDLTAVEETVAKLSSREDPLCSVVPGTRGRGLKYLHLFYGQPEIQKNEDSMGIGFRPLIEDEVRLLRLEVETLKEEIARIKQELGME
ncbi:MAG: YceH family protein [Bacteroidetes bacterium]|nr:YceH family protein [Bacteroidota bacterium]